MRNQADERGLISFERLLNATVKYAVFGADAQGEFDCAGFGMNCSERYGLKTLDSLPMQLKVVWNLRPHAGSEGPALIFDTALRQRLAPPRIRDTLVLLC
jgi:hypothetical protein